jgi:hypothetical protein
LNRQVEVFCSFFTIRRFAMAVSRSAPLFVLALLAMTSLPGQAAKPVEAVPPEAVGAGKVDKTQPAPEPAAQNAQAQGNADKASKAKRKKAAPSGAPAAPAPVM